MARGQQPRVSVRSIIEKDTGGSCDWARLGDVRSDCRQSAR